MKSYKYFNMSFELYGVAIARKSVGIKKAMSKHNGL